VEVDISLIVNTNRVNTNRHESNISQGANIFQPHCSSTWLYSSAGIREVASTRFTAPENMVVQNSQSRSSESEVPDAAFYDL